MALPGLDLPATSGKMVNPGGLQGVAVVCVYPMTGRPDRALPGDWDESPGARGCICLFRYCRMPMGRSAKRRRCPR